MSYILESKSSKKISNGNISPLGATLNKGGVNFAIYSKYSKEAFLLLFDSPDSEPTDIIKIETRKNDTWHVFVHGLKAGQLYGYKFDGDYNPKEGVRFNKHKLLLDPYAKAISGKCENKDNLLFSYNVNSINKDLTMDTRDNAIIFPKSIVIADDFNWEGDKGVKVELNKAIIYEVHLKGFTAHQTSGVKNPGTYLGFIEKIPYLKDLGITAVEFLPIHEAYDQDFLAQKELSDYWGYNTIGFFAPESSYSNKCSTGCQVNEFKTLVQEIHKAGISVILDVVYNHTGEGNHLGPSVCFRGIDNQTYYALAGNMGEPYRNYINDAGCGNILDVEKPVVLKMIIDSLKYWVLTMHVDGFRFDLAPIITREKGKYNKRSPFFEAIENDHVLKNIPMIAEPWDLTTYQVGNFPKGWSEWNGKFRDISRKFIKGDDNQTREFAMRLTGSSDLYGDDGRNPYNSINFITCHDGFTLNDLYSYNSKHNEANLENNRDGSDSNYSWNCGFEGETQDADILKLRKRMIKNAICTLIFSQGTPMLLGGDEFMRTQKGNNNAYCQDNDISWFNWNDVQKNADIWEFTTKAINFRKRYTILHRGKFLIGQDMDADNVSDILWFGDNADKPDWNNLKLKTVAFQLDGSEEPSELGNYHLFLIFNADLIRHTVKLPHYDKMQWYRVVDTNLNNGQDFLAPGQELFLNPQDSYVSNSRTVIVFLGIQNK